MTDGIASFIEHELESRRIPGAAIAVLRPGEPVWARGFGAANIKTGEPFTPRTPFSIQSITKTFVGTAVMQLAEKRLLSVDDPVSKHLPGVVKNQWEAENPVLIRRLLTHTSGLPVDTGGGPPAGPHRLEDFVRAVAKTVRPPGSEIVYANWGYDLLGLIIEKLTGETWYGYITRHICEPLGMISAAAYPAPEDAAHGHYLSAVDGALHRLGHARWPVEPSDPAGGLVSTVEDLAVFAAAHLRRGAPLLRPETAAQMHAVAVAEPGGGGMALGFRVTRSNGRLLLCHGGDGSGFTNFFGLYPDEGVAVILTLNRAGVQAARSVIANTVLSMLAGDNLRAEPARRPVSGAGAVGGIAPQPGLYTSSFWDIEVALETTGDGVTARPVSGLVISDGPEPSVLATTGRRSFRAENGMFHGFEITVADDGALHGGLYPCRFSRTGDLPASDPPVDAAADLIGAWSGSVKTPIGDLIMRIEVSGASGAAVSTPFCSDVPLEDCDARDGHVSGRFALTVPVAGELTMYPRLEVRGGKLKGPVYAQGWFGEMPMPAELEEA